MIILDTVTNQCFRGLDFMHRIVFTIWGYAVVHPGQEDAVGLNVPSGTIVMFLTFCSR